MIDFEVHPSGTATTLATCEKDVALLAECLQMMFIISEELESEKDLGREQRLDLCKDVDELRATLWNRLHSEYVREATAQREREEYAKRAKSAPFVRPQEQS